MQRHQSVKTILAFVRYNKFICEYNLMPTLSIHGDVRIPDNLIHALGLKPGEELAFERQGDAIVIRSIKTSKCSRVEDGPKILGYT